MGLADVTPAPPVADPSPAGPNGRRTEGILALLFGGFTAVIGCVLLLGGVALVLTHAPLPAIGTATTPRAALA